jgi:predicted amidohydrolase
MTPRSSDHSVRVAACQLGPRIGETAGNRAAARDAIDIAAGQGAHVVVLPELVSSGYVFADAAEARSLAEPADGPTVRQWQQLAARHDLVIVGGFCELGESGQVLNSAAIVDGSGTRAVYRKAHLWDAEPDVFTPGDADPPVVSTAYGRIGVMVCYDAEFPEWVRKPALAGADLLALPTNWPAEPRPDGERPMVVLNVQAAASANRIFIAAADRCGTERGVRWVGGAVIAGVDGYPLAGPVCADEPAVLLADCDLRLARSKANSPRNDVHADRRPALYR